VYIDTCSYGPVAIQYMGNIMLCISANIDRIISVVLNLLLAIIHVDSHNRFLPPRKII
jgi:hypothetical protein